MAFQMIANYHTHTWRCGHAAPDERAYIEKAIEGGYEILGFSDHGPQRFPNGYHSGFRMQLDQLEGYVRTLTDLRAEYRNEITILIGYEMEYYPLLFPETLERVCGYPIDYMILGQHFIENEITHHYAMDIRTDRRHLTTYVDEILEGLSTGAYSYVAHPDLPDWEGDPEFYRSEMIRFCEGAKRLRIPMEVNLLGLSGRRCYPSARFFRIAAEVGCDIVIGCDAHSPDMVFDPVLLGSAVDFCTGLGLNPLQKVSLNDPRLALNSSGKRS